MSFLARKANLDKIKNYSIHLANITEAIKEHRTAYTGKEHFEAAAIVAEVDKNAALSFDYLASGAYWAAHNMPKALDQIEKQMCGLAKQENWKDVLDAFDFMGVSMT